MNDEIDLSPAEVLAMQARQRGEPNEPLPYKAMTLRVPFSLLASVDALAQLTGKSRNSTLISLIEAGVFAVRQELDDDSEFEAIKEALLDHFSEN